MIVLNIFISNVLGMRKLFPYESSSLSPQDPLVFGLGNCTDQLVSVRFKDEI